MLLPDDAVRWGVGGTEKQHHLVVPCILHNPTGKWERLTMARMETDCCTMRPICRTQTAHAAIDVKRWDKTESLFSVTSSWSSNEVAVSLISFTCSSGKASSRVLLLPSSRENSSSTFSSGRWVKLWWSSSSRENSTSTFSSESAHSARWWDKSDCLPHHWGKNRQGLVEVQRENDFDEKECRRLNTTETGNNSDVACC